MGEGLKKTYSGIYSKGLTLGYTVKTLNLFNLHLFSNVAY